MTTDYHVEYADGRVEPIRPRTVVYALFRHRSDGVYALAADTPTFPTRQIANNVADGWGRSWVVRRVEPVTPRSLVPDPDADVEMACEECGSEDGPGFVNFGCVDEDCPGCGRCDEPCITCARRGS